MDARNLVEELPEGFQEAAARRLRPAEQIVISLRGSIGEALVVTGKRVLVLRERETGTSPEIDAHVHWLGTIRSVQAAAEGTAGILKIETSQPAPGQDTARIYFPAGDLAKFTAAAEVISAMAKQFADSQREDEGSRAQHGAAACPTCGARTAERAGYCHECGTQLAPICAFCGRPALEGASYCPGCGNEFVEQPTSCPNCKARIMPYQLFCRQCGAVLGVSCAGCGSAVVPGDRHCRTCGRLLGSPDAAAARAVRNRAADIQERQTAPAQPEPQEAQPSEPVSDAEAHNRRGRELFEQEDFEGAIREFQAAVSLDPGNASYHCNLAVAYDENDQDDLALGKYEKTLELDPNDLTALLSLGYLYSENEQPEWAKQVWDRILQIAPTSPEAQEVQDNLRHQGQL